MRIWPASLEDKLRCMKHRQEQGDLSLWAVNFDEVERKPERYFYLTYAEEQFLMRAKQPKRYAWISCRFCQREGMWDSRGLDSHINACSAHKEYLEIRRYREEHQQERGRGWHWKQLSEEEAFHREDIVEFSGGPKASEGAIIHTLIEDWEIDDLGVSSTRFLYYWRKKADERNLRAGHAEAVAD